MPSPGVLTSNRSENPSSGWSVIVSVFEFGSQLL
jgi:hypothetical protein